MYNLRIMISMVTIVEMGRIFVDLSYYKGGSLVYKPEWLKKKYEFYARWLRKNLNKTEETWIHIGDEAARLAKEEGYILRIQPGMNMEVTDEGYKV